MKQTSLLPNNGTVMIVDNRTLLIFQFVLCQRKRVWECVHCTLIFHCECVYICVCVVAVSLVENSICFFFLCSVLLWKWQYIGVPLLLSIVVVSMLSCIWEMPSNKWYFCCHKLRALCVCWQSHLEYFIPFIWFRFCCFHLKKLSMILLLIWTKCMDATCTSMSIEIYSYYVNTRKDMNCFGVVVSFLMYVWYFFFISFQYWAVWDFNLCSLIIPVDDPCTVDYWTHSLVLVPHIELLQIH